MVSTNTKQFPRGLRWLAYLGMATLALAVTAVLTARSAPSLLALNNETVWYAIRASGVVAYLLLAASTVWGVMLSSKIVKHWVPAAVSLDLHTYLSWLAIGLSILHAVLLLFSSYFDYSLINLFVPFTGPFEPFWIGLGIVGVYLMVATSATFYMTQRIGYKAFRRIHLLTYVAFVAVLLHSIVAGTDKAAMAPVYIATALVVVFFTAYRVLSTDRPS
jgi:predicted ferric reductase